MIGVYVAIYIPILMVYIRWKGTLFQADGLIGKCLRDIRNRSRDLLLPAYIACLAVEMAHSIMTQE